MENTVNLNQAECLQRISNFGKTTIVNVCSGTHTDIPWGNVDWLISLGGIFAGVAGIIFVAGIGVMFIAMCWGDL